MDRQYLGVPATSASAERLFSIAGRTYDDLRQHLNDDMLETTMWARINREKRHSNRSVYVGGGLMGKTGYGGGDQVFGVFSSVTERSLFSKGYCVLHSLFSIKGKVSGYILVLAILHFVKYRIAQYGLG